MKRRALAGGITALLALALFTTALSAHPGDDVILAVDVIPLNNTATSLAELESCAAAKTGDVFEVDIVVSGVIDLLAWETTVSYDPNVLEVIRSDAAIFQAANVGSQVLDLSEKTPSSSGVYNIQAVDVADPPAPDSGSGVLARLTFKAIGNGISAISLEKLDLDGDGLPDRGPMLRDVDGRIIGDTDDDTLFDGASNAGEIRVGERCPDSNTSVVTIGGDGSPKMKWALGGGISGVLVAGLAVGLAVAIRRRSRH